MSDEVDRLRLIVELLRAMTEDLDQLTATLEKSEEEREQTFEEWA